MNAIAPFNMTYTEPINPIPLLWFFIMVGKVFEYCTWFDGLKNLPELKTGGTVFS